MAKAKIVKSEAAKIEGLGEAENTQKQAADVVAKTKKSAGKTKMDVKNSTKSAVKPSVKKTTAKVSAAKDISRNDATSRVNKIAEAVDTVKKMNPIAGKKAKNSKKNKNASVKEGIEP